MLGFAKKKSATSHWDQYLLSLHDVHHGEEDDRQKGSHSQRHALHTRVQSHDHNSITTSCLLGMQTQSAVDSYRQHTTDTCYQVRDAETQSVKSLPFPGSMRTFPDGCKCTHATMLLSIYY